MVFLEDYETAIECLKRSLAEYPGSSKAKYRLVVAIIFQHRKTLHLVALKEKEEREMRVKSLMSKVCYFQLRKSAKAMGATINLPDRTFNF